MSIHKWLICPISALSEKFNPRNITHMPAVKFFVRLDIDQIIEGTNYWCPSISGWTLTNAHPEMAVFVEFYTGENISFSENTI